MSADKFAGVTDEELAAELARREAENDVRPQAIPVPDWSPLVQYLEEGMDKVETEGEVPKDFEQYIYETALEALYGPNVWDWWNKHKSG